MTRISVIIPSYNSFLTIGRTLEELLKQPSELLEEILVVDSSEDGKTREVLAKYASDKIEIVKLPKKTMPGDGRNIGAGLAKAPLLAFIDSDAYPAPDWLQKIEEAYRRGHRTGAGALLVADSQQNRVLPLAQYFLQFNEYMDTGREREKAFAVSCNMFCERALFEKVGGFPPIRALEDVSFGHKAGEYTKIFLFPQIRVFHIFRMDWKPFFGNQELLGKYTYIYRSQKEKGRFYYGGLWPFVFLPGFVLLRVLWITLRILHSRRASLIVRYFLVFPVFLAGLFYWAIGFVKGILIKNKRTTV